MQGFEYKVINAPRKPGKARGVKGFDDKYAHTLAELMNEMADEGWTYVRADTLPADEKTGMFGKVTEKFLTLLVFQRIKPEIIAEAAQVEAETSENRTGAPGRPRREPPIGTLAGEQDTSTSDPMRLNKPLSDDEFAENIRGLLEQDEK